MNYKMVGFVLGRIFLIEAALMLFPMGCAAIYGEWASIPAFLIPVLILLVLGLAASLKSPKDTKIYARDGLAIVALVWVLLSVFGALPFVITGEIPSFVDALFETVSGFTTTGSTILTDVESLSHGILFWRSFSHWIGGMGVLVFAMAVLPMTDGRAMHLMRAEVPGPTCGKISSKLSDSAKILYAIYLAMTVIETVMLCAGGMPLFDSMVHSFGSAGTGGFGIRADSIASYSPYCQWVITVFMLLFGVNFNLYYLLLAKKFRAAAQSSECWYYLGIVAAAIVLICINVRSYFASFSDTLRAASFQVVSIITTTGYSTTDFDLWPHFSRTLLMVLMVIGACAGSTGGGMKVSRVVLLFKMAGRELKHVLHPRSVNTVKFEGKRIDGTTLKGVSSYLALYVICVILIVLVLSAENYDITTNLSATLSCFNNIGPGLSLVGPSGSFGIFNGFSKLVLSFAMLLGRLEIIPMLVLFSPSTWLKK